ncbi:hypothetical protein KBZ10_05290 [Streptomyces sp. F63]|uniref:hypothetical protein n=1 Tax=Streptomyces sp. F63 TaxID=2824887 RepID=UPI001B38BA41|nr:hypothetical protein [Streptomyces sp. F63]MBQ0983947.1 hypothetical protein [Streptomyces sp. F63]
MTPTPLMTDGAPETAAPAKPGGGPVRTSPALAVLRIESLRGTAPWTFAICLATLLIAVFGGRDPYQADWPAMAQHAHALQILLGPLVAGAACWEAGRERRRHTAEWARATPRPTLHRLTAGLFPVWLAAVAAYLVTWAVLTALTWPNASAYGHPLLGPVLVDLAAVAAFAAGGHLLGRYVPWWPVAPLAALSGYAALVLWNVPASSGLAQLIPAAFDIREGSEPALWASAAHTAWFAGLAAAMLLAAGARRKWLAALPLAVAVAGAVPLVQQPGAVWVYDRAAAEFVCEGERPQICMRRAHEGMRERVADPVRWAYGLTAGAPGAPARFEERAPAPGGRSAAGPDAVEVRIVHRGDLGSDRRLDYFQRDAVLQSLLAWDCRSERIRPEWSHEVLLWAHGQWPGAMDDRLLDTPVVKALDTMSRAERAAWFADWFAAARACDPDRVTRP